MFTFTTASTHLPFPLPNLISSESPISHAVRSAMWHPPPPRRQLASFLGCCSLRFLEPKRVGFSGFLRRCKDWDSEGDSKLEDEILEFMKNSEKPDAFPSKKELVEAGRLDLVEGIVNQGGWLSLGWDLDQESGQESDFRYWETPMYQGFESKDSSYDSAPSSSRPIEAATDEADTGIEGILNRLEKQRNWTLGFISNDKEDSDAIVAATSRSIRPASSNPTKAIPNDPRGKPNRSTSHVDVDVLINSPKHETWRSWSTQRVGSSDPEFEAGEVSYDEMGGSEVVLQDVIPRVKEGATEMDGRHELDSHHGVINYKQVRSLLWHLESELSTVLHSLRSKTNCIALKEGHEGSSDELQKLSDAWELQENEIMHAQHKLRSTRAKLAILEGKMAIELFGAQKVLEKKQKRVNDAHRASRVLRTALIVWTNSASEVLLAGSFDGWASQKKMEKSSTGIFRLNLKLYPGTYEIKFIVDGEWRIDPLRPIVHNNGYKNNVLIIT